MSCKPGADMLEANSLPLAAQKAGMVKLVDIPDLGSGAARHGGSSPSTRTEKLIG